MQRFQLCESCGPKQPRKLSQVSDADIVQIARQKALDGDCTSASPSSGSCGVVEVCSKVLKTTKIQILSNNRANVVKIYHQYIMMNLFKWMMKWRDLSLQMVYRHTLIMNIMELEGH